DGAAHPLVDFGYFTRHAAANCRRKVLRCYADGGARGLPEITTELPAPILEYRRFAPAGQAIFIRDLDEDIAADRFGQACPFVLAAGRKRDAMQLDQRNR